MTDRRSAPRTRFAGSHPRKGWSVLPHKFFKKADLVVSSFRDPRPANFGVLGRDITGIEEQRA